MLHGIVFLEGPCLHTATCVNTQCESCCSVVLRVESVLCRKCTSGCRVAALRSRPADIVLATVCPAVCCAPL